MYSDPDNIVVGLMAERVTGVPYARLIHRELSRRTGDLPETTLPRTVRMPRPLLHGYEIDPPEEPEDVSFPISPAGAWASGGTVSTLPGSRSFATEPAAAPFSVTPAPSPGHRVFAAASADGRRSIATAQITPGLGSPTPPGFRP